MDGKARVLTDVTTFAGGSISKGITVEHELTRSGARQPLLIGNKAALAAAFSRYTGHMYYLALTGDTISIPIEFRLVASMVSSHISHAHGVGLGTVSRAGLP